MRAADPAGEELNEAGGSLLRLRYRKTGSARYISNLDLMAIMGRALIRAGVELKYSEGFNPHPYISVALPLPVGCSSVCELADVRLAAGAGDARIPERVTAVLPDGLKVLEAYVSGKKFSGIAWVKLEGRLFYDSGTSSETLTGLERCFSAESIFVRKKTKSGLSDIDISPHVKSIKFSGANYVKMEAVVSAQNPSVSPAMLAAAIGQSSMAPVPDFCLFTRAEIYDINMDVFR